ncbi:universal stress protein [Desulforhopalus singaporensis]|uniref:Universal stress protein family protein n=1 Tax=Desulforhopalus singaporensis TaxID=91360 RepID=A0A1H0UGT5_9BACT|nr:universal stress protein [Desulforhopalus singaporensis]SDP65290.1 Universal stress protein family protein [Desulforhopalus singaporensis]
MDKHLLVTISDDCQNLSGVKFLSSFFDKLSRHQLTLLHICRIDNTEMEKELLDMWQDPDRNGINALTPGGKRAITRARKIIRQSKMSIASLKTKAVKEKYGKVKDILTEGSKGLYDAIVLGRRASYTLQWLFERPAEETPHAMIKDSCFTTPLWVCPEPDVDRRDVLVAIDGSEHSFRAVDHVGYMLSHQKQHRITLLHLENSAISDVRSLFQRADRILHEHGINDERISHRSYWSISIPGAILTLTEQEKYAAVAVGQHGIERNKLKEYNLSGGTTAKLVARIEKTSLWCCP